MKFRVINGPNLNLLGIREQKIYGTRTYGDLEASLARWAEEEGVGIDCFQSNSEGAIVDMIQKCYADGIDGIIINPAAYTHTSIAILDALKAVAIPAVEVHLSDTEQREPYRRISYVREYCFATIQGMGFEGYRQAILRLKKRTGDEHR